MRSKRASASSKRASSKRASSKRARPSQTKRFCRCIKSVRRTSKRSEQRAIAICVSSVLQTKGRTLKRFRCRPPAFLRTQPFPLSSGSSNLSH